MTNSFAERRAKLLAERAQKAEQSNWTPGTWDPDLVPQVKEENNRNQEDLELDQALERIDIISAYRTWCGKMTPDVNGRTEGIKISCPKPDHPDRDPSAWINTEKGTWYCGGCDEGGDKYDIAAYCYNMENYKSDGSTFVKLRIRMAEDFGYTIKKLPGNQQLVLPPDPVQSDPDAADPEQSVELKNHKEQDQATVTPIRVLEPDEEEIEEQFYYPRINWRKFVPQDTFLYEYCEQTCHDDSPEEYHFWHGLLALGHAVGRNVTLADTPAVYGNMLVCIIGPTGAGKSTSRRWLKEVINDVLPFNRAMTPPSGVKMTVASGSGEHLITQFIEEQIDPTGLKSLQPVNGMVEYDEMSRIVNTMKAQRSTLKEVIMQLGDTDHRVTAGSLSHGDKIAIEPFASLTTSTQPRTVRVLFSDADAGSGFLNRWIFVAGPVKQRQSMGGKWARYSVELATAKELLKHIRRWGIASKQVDFQDQKTFKIWDSYFHSILQPEKEKDETHLLQRLDLIHKKLMLLLAVNQRSEVITPDIIYQTQNLTNYLLQCYGLINENIGVTRNKEISDEILRHAVRHHKATGRGMSKRDLSTYIKRKNWPDKQIWEAMDMLVKMDKLEIEKPPPGPGRKTERYKAVGE